MKNIVVLGAGTAGWASALYLKKILPKSEITVVYSEEIGVIGVGEGTTPNFIDFLEEVDIPLESIIIHAEGTIKNGILFKNWNGEKDEYFHGFGNTYDFSIENLFENQSKTEYLQTLINKELRLADYEYTASLSNSNLIDIENIYYAMHFDSFKLGELFKNIAIERGIKTVEGKLSKVLKDKKDFITGIELDNNKNVHVDFLIDCSGQNREILNKVYGQKWISYSKYLPMKKAIPFWLDTKEEIVPYTTATAMKNGWLWEIPLQSRIGAGYVFDSNYTDEHEAKKELEEHYGIDINIRKIISFDAGRLENVWVKNSLALGLASSFVEPLEATSIFLTLAQLMLFKRFVTDIDNIQEEDIKYYNKVVAENMDGVLDFICLHYETNRSDSKFWKELHKKKDLPDSAKKLIHNIKNNRYAWFHNTHFPQSAYFSYDAQIQVGHGLNLVNKKINSLTKVVPTPEDFKQIIDTKKLECNYPIFNHRVFIEKVVKGV